MRRGTLKEIGNTLYCLFRVIYDKSNDKDIN